MKHVRRIIPVLAIFLLFFLIILPGRAQAAVVSSGYCGAQEGGKNLTWTLDDAGTLTISGVGGMRSYRPPNYDVEDFIYSPWMGSQRIKTVVIQNGVTHIGDQAFCGCKSLTRVIIPDSVTDIGDVTCSGCTGLTSITIPDGVSYIGYCTFSGCTGLTNLTIPDSVRGIDEWAFYGCTGLTNLTIPDSVDISREAFWNCTGLNSVTITDGVEVERDFFYDHVAYDAFRGCTNITHLEIGSVIAIDTYKIPTDKIPTENLKTVTITDGVNRIASGAFSGCTGLTSIALPDEVTNIEPGAFYGCTGLTSIALPDKVTNIEPGVFEGCTGLNIVLMGTRVETIDRYAFPPDVNVYYAGSEEQWEKIKTFEANNPDNPQESYEKPIKVAFYDCYLENGVVYNNEKTTVQTIYDTSFTEIAIPEGVTRIGPRAFERCTELSSISLPASLTRVDMTAFDNCAALTAFYVDEANPVFSAVDGVLYNKAQTELVRYPEAKDGAAFSFPETVTAVAAHAFADQGYLTDVQIPDSVVSLGEGCFARCTALQTAAVGGGAVALPEEMFTGCSALTAVLIPDGVERIGKNAFYGCAKLATVTLSRDVGRIDENAFSGCDGLDDIFFTGTADEWTAIGVKPGNDTLTGAKKTFGYLILPQKVTNITLVKAGDVSVTLQWKAVNGATEYRIYRFDAQTETFVYLTTVAASPYVIPGLQPDTEYQFTVEAATVTADQTLVAEKSDLILVRTTEEQQRMGDVSGDGEITAEDARLALRGAVGLERYAPGSAEFSAADADKNGVLEAADARLILRAAVGLETLA